MASLSVYAFTPSLHNTRRVTRQQKQQKRPIYVDSESPTSTTSLSPERPSKRQRLALDDITKTGANRQRRPGGGRKRKTAEDARAVDTTREDVVNTTGETVVLGRLPSRLPQALHHNSHLNGHTVIQRDRTPVNPRLQVVPSQRDPAPASTFEEVPEEIAPEPAPEYTARTLRQHARQERTAEDRADDRPTRKRGPYRRTNATDGGRTLGLSCQLCRDPNATKEVELYTVHGSFRNASNKCPHCAAQSWREERGPDNRWPCCDNGKNDWKPPDQSVKPEDVDGLPDGPEKDRELIAREINNLLYEMETVQVGNETVYRRTARSKEFIENIVSYNNCLSFTSEGTNNVDHNVGRTTFRIQGSVHHLMGPLMADEGLKPKFAQIYTLDGTQEQLDVRQHYFDALNQATLTTLQRSLRSINPYVEGFKNCYDRLKEDEQQHPIDTMCVRIQQLDPRRQSRGTHNRPTSTEVARVMITPDDALKGRIERDIRVETKEGGLMAIPDWHSSYMALRYPLLFPFGEQSWHDRIPLAGHNLPGDHPLNALRRNRTAGTLSRHNMEGFDDNPEEELGDGDPEHEEDPNDNGQRAPRGRGGSTRLTRRQCYVKWMQIRLDHFNRVVHGGRLFSHWATDTWASIELNDLNWYRQNQQSIRADCYSGLMDRLSTDPDVSLKDIGSKVTILPSTMPGSPRYMKAKMQDAMAIVRKRGKPEYFVTFTCNPKWPDLQELLKPIVTEEHRHDLTARIFKQKLDELLKDLLERHILGKTVAHCYVIEFQKRGLPHAHILLIMREEDRIHGVQDVDSVVQAFVPKEGDDGELYKLVLQHMVHNRCTGHPKDVCYSKEKNCCSKAFPKDFREETSFAPDGSYPFYKRPSGPPTGPNGDIDNRWVVPYNPYLLKKYGAHINIEICGSIKSVFYLYKYVYKGPDRADITLTRQSTRYEDNPAPSGRPRQRGELVDEITEFHSARWIGSAEAVWKMLSFGMGTMKPHVERLQIHLPDQQRVLFQPAENVAAAEAEKQKLIDNEKLRRTTLTEYFNMNRLAKRAHDSNQPLPFTKTNGRPLEVMKDPLDYLYADFPEHFTWVKSKKKWKVREKGEALGRINFISPKTKDLYYCRLLLCHRKGATSFDDLRTVDGHLMEWKEACVELGLTENDKHADEVLEEGSHMQGGYGLRSLFVMVLLQLQPTDALALWNKYKEFISSDCTRILQRDFPTLQIPDGEQDSYAEQYALYLIDGQLEHASTPECVEDLARYNLPIPTINFDGMSDIPNRLLREEMSYNITPDEAELAWSKLNPDQRVAADTIMDAIASNVDDEYGAPGALFFLNGAGGTGKTMVQNTVMQKLRSEQKVALAVASSGIAATLLQGGRTAHSRFKIPLDSDTTSSCGIKKGTNLAELIKRASVIFWDESPMQSRYDMEAVSRSLQDICGNEQAWFGGKVVCFCGDFRQTLPVVPGGSSGQVIEACVQKAEFWPDITRLDLTINERLNNPDLTDAARVDMRRFADALLTIGDGNSIKKSSTTNEDVAPWEYGHVPENVLDELIEKVYTDIHNARNTFTKDYLSERAILAIANKDVASINSKIMAKMPGELTTYWSVDRAASEEDEELFPTEYFNAFYEASLPPHKLCVKPGVPVMLLRNLDPPRLCNGTRLRITRCGKQVFEGEIMGGTHHGEKVMLFKTPLQSKENNKRIPTPFVRKQYPVRPAFAMTINKSQGQSMKYVGINLQARPAFSHGQLYVALSRVTRQGNLHVIGPDVPEYTNERLMKNVVYKQVLLDS